MDQDLRNWNEAYGLVRQFLDVYGYSIRSMPPDLTGGFNLCVGVHLVRRTLSSQNWSASGTADTSGVFGLGDLQQAAAPTPAGHASTRAYVQSCNRTKHLVVYLQSTSAPAEASLRITGHFFQHREHICVRSASGDNPNPTEVNGQSFASLHLLSLHHITICIYCI